MKWILALSLFMGLYGSFLSMLNWGPQLLITAIVETFHMTGLMDGFRLVANRLFEVSEQYQAYRYTMFVINLPESALDAHLAAALIIIAALNGILCVLLVHTRLKALVVAAVLVVAAFQVYFGVFPGAAWNIALFATFALMLVFRRDGRANLRSYVVFITSIALVTAMVWLIYPNENPGLHSFSESLRDRFALQTTRLAGPPPDVQGGGFEYEPENLVFNVVDVREDTLHQSPLDDYHIEHDERVGGGVVGAAIPQTSLIALFILTLVILAIAAVAIYFAPPLMKAAKRRKRFNTDDCSTAINHMFVYLIEWLTVYGLERENVVFSAYAAQINQLVSQEYSNEYEGMATLWRKAVYSNHKQSEAERKLMSDFMNKTMSIVWRNSNWMTRLRIKLQHFL